MEKYLFQDSTIAEREILNQYYLSCDFSATFPLIGANILDKNKVSKIVVGNQLIFFVTSQLGFSQLISLKPFEENIDLKEIIEFIFKKWAMNKLRLYPPINITNSQYLTSNYIRYQSFRTRFSYEKVVLEESSFHPDYKFVFGEELESILPLIPVDLTNRFYNNPINFARASYAMASVHCQDLVSICYSAATYNNYTEIDVQTFDKFKRNGFGKATVKQYIANLSKFNLTPTWDCFSNNRGSFSLAKRMGFKPLRINYSFLTIPNI